MAVYQNIPATVANVDGTLMEVVLIENPIIDDVLIAEAKVQAYFVYNNQEPASDRRVERTIRDYLIRLGVAR
jgi:hypothetical protein